MDGIQEYQRRENTLERWWNYRGLWRESLDERPSAASVYRGLLISYICLCVLSIFVNPYNYGLKSINQPRLTVTFPSIEEWLPTTLTFIVLFIVYGVLWHWGKIKNNRHIISVLMYLMLFLIGVLVAVIVGFHYKASGSRELRFIYEAYELRELFFYLMFPTLLVSPILVMWIQGWRQALIFSMIFLFPCYIIMALTSGSGIG